MRFEAVMRGWFDFRVYNSVKATVLYLFNQIFVKLSAGRITVVIISNIPACFRNIFLFRSVKNEVQERFFTL